MTSLAHDVGTTPNSCSAVDSHISPLYMQLFYSFSRCLLYVPFPHPR